MGYMEALSFLDFWYKKMSTYLRNASSVRLGKYLALLQTAGPSIRLRQLDESGVLINTMAVISVTSADIRNPFRVYGSPSLYRFVWTEGVTSSPTSGEPAKGTGVAVVDFAQGQSSYVHQSADTGFDLYLPLAPPRRLALAKKIYWIENRENAVDDVDVRLMGADASLGGVSIISSANVTSGGTALILHGIAWIGDSVFVWYAAGPGVPSGIVQLFYSGSVPVFPCPASDGDSGFFHLGHSYPTSENTRATGIGALPSVELCQYKRGCSQTLPVGTAGYESRFPVFGSPPTQVAFDELGQLVLVHDNVSGDVKVTFNGGLINAWRSEFNVSVALTDFVFFGNED